MSDVEERIWESINWARSKLGRWPVVCLVSDEEYDEIERDCIRLLYIGLVGVPIRRYSGPRKDWGLD